MVNIKILHTGAFTLLPHKQIALTNNSEKHKMNYDTFSSRRRLWVLSTSPFMNLVVIHTMLAVRNAHIGAIQAAPTPFTC